MERRLEAGPSFDDLKLFAEFRKPVTVVHFPGFLPLTLLICTNVVLQRDLQSRKKGRDCSLCDGEIIRDGECSNQSSVPEDFGKHHSRKLRRG